VNLGSHRSVPPETTLPRVRPFWDALGITRLAVLTGLDVVGIPVAAAYRPNSRSIAVHQGKGTTLAAAKVSAVMEAVECWHAETFAGPLRLAAADELADAVALDRLPLTGVGDPAARMLWTGARDLATGARLSVPFELVSADFTVPAPAGFGVFRQTTNGLGAGNTNTEAALQALYEVVERDAVALWHAASPARQAACAVDPASVDGPASRWLLERFAAAGVAVRIFDVTTGIGLPAFQALVCDADGVAGIEPELGAGCHAGADIALARALSEAAQARVTRISAARDDFAAASFAPDERGSRHEAAQRWLRMLPAREFSGRNAAATAEQDLDDALAALGGAGFGQVACVDLGRPEIGIPVARVIVPGLEGAYETGRPMGARALAVA
jgi:ribosomal protein S12 methylthiotransferase accessory factor